MLLAQGGHEALRKRARAASHLQHPQRGLARKPTLHQLGQHLGWIGLASQGRVGESEEVVEGGLDLVEL